MAQYIPENAVILEGGAHVGTDTEALAKMFPKGRIHAFEPVPDLFAQLEERTKIYPNVTRYPIALSHADGSAVLHVSGGRSISSSSLLAPKEHLTFHPDVVFEKDIQVECVALDHWAKKAGLKHIDFIWLDVQGHELNVLKSGTEILKTVAALYTEVNLKELYEGAPLYPEFRAWLEGQGFIVVQEALDWEDAGNVLFARQLR